MDRNADCCVNTVDEKNSYAKHLVNFGTLTPEILWLICMGGNCNVLVKGHSLDGSSVASL